MSQGFIFTVLNLLTRDVTVSVDCSNALEGRLTKDINLTSGMQSEKIYLEINKTTPVSITFIANPSITGATTGTVKVFFETSSFDPLKGVSYVASGSTYSEMNVGGFKANAVLMLMGMYTSGGYKWPHSQLALVGYTG